MSKITKQDALIEALEKADPYRKEIRKKRNNIIGHAGVIISASAIAMSLFLFAYNRGISEKYGIPTDLIPINLNGYFYLAFYTCMVAIYVLLYVSYFKVEKILNKHSFNIIRVITGWVLFVSIGHHFSIGRTGRTLLISVYIIISLLIPLVIEIISLCIRRRVYNKKHDKCITQQEKQVIIENTIQNIIIRDYLKVFGLVFVIIPTILAPFGGNITVWLKHDYQVFLDNNQQYAVIVDYSDSVVAQKAEVEDNSLAIDASKYYLFSKESREFVYSYYNDVIINKPKNENVDLLSATIDQISTTMSVITN